jgi:hypothetical protein
MTKERHGAGAGKRCSPGSDGDSHTLSLVDGKGYDPSWVIDVGLIENWLKTVDEATYDQVVAALQMLSEVGPALGRPLVDSVVGSRHKNMKELRPGSSGRSEVRILFAFDPRRRAIMLLAGDKQGTWSKWYRKNIPVADDRYDEHLTRLHDERRDEKGGK